MRRREGAVGVNADTCAPLRTGQARQVLTGHYAGHLRPDVVRTSMLDVSADPCALLVRPSLTPGAEERGGQDGGFSGDHTHPALWNNIEKWTGVSYHLCAKCCELAGYSNRLACSGTRRFVARPPGHRGGCRPSGR